MRAYEKEIIVDKEANKNFFHATLKVADNKKRIIKGRASTTFEDRDGEVIPKDTIQVAFESFIIGGNTPILLGHNRDKPIGKVISGFVDEAGLTIEAEIAKGTRDSDEAWALIEQDVLKAFSVGFIRKDVDYSKRPAVYKEIELIEVSVVSIPSNRQSLFSVAKALDTGSDLIEQKTIDRSFDARFKVFCKEMGFFQTLYSQDFLSPKDKLAIDEFGKSIQSIGVRDEYNQIVLLQKQLDQQVETINNLERQKELLSLQVEELLLLTQDS